MKATPSLPPAAGTPGRKGRPRKYHGICKAPEHPDSVEHARKCVYAAKLRYLYGQTWQEIAATLWPIDDNGNPTPDAAPMWNSRDSAEKGVKFFQRSNLSAIREDLVDEVKARVAMRQAALAPAVDRGDMFAIQQHRAEDEFLMKIAGGYAPVKIAPTTPDGEKPYESPSATAVESLSRKLDQLAARREAIVPGEPDA